MTTRTGTQFDPSNLDPSTRFRYDTLTDAIAVHKREGTPDDDHTFIRLREMLSAIENGQVVSRVAESAAARNPERKQGGARGANQYGAYTVRSASPGQLRFIAKLLRERVFPADYPKTFSDAVVAYKRGDGSLSLKAATDLIDWLQTLDMDTSVPVPTATDKQVDSIRREAGRRKLTDSQTELVAHVVADLDAGRTVNRKVASAVLDVLFNAPFAPRKAAAVADEITQDGMYQTADGTVYKVQIAKQGSGRLYAKRLVVETDQDGNTEAVFVYAAGAISKLRPTDRMSLEAAKAFGQLYGVCCNCGAELTDENSIAEGIGPICAKKDWA